MIISRHIVIPSTGVPVVIFTATDETELFLRPVGSVSVGDERLTSPNLGFDASTGFDISPNVVMHLHLGDVLYGVSPDGGSASGVSLLAVVGKATVVSTKH